MKAIKPPMSTRELIELSLIGALMFVSQIAMSALPNINIVSVLIIITVSLYGVKAFYPVAIFVLLEGLLYGFGLWVINYIYVWPVLIVISLIFRKNQSRLIWAAIAGFFGLSFGFLCALLYLFVGGFGAAVAYWVSGIPFDITHCISNFVLTFLLYKPLRTLIDRCRYKAKQ